MDIPSEDTTAAPTDPVAEAFAATPRQDFLPPEQRPHAAQDGPLDIGHGQTSSQPRTVEAMLRLLEVRRGDSVLDVGAGSGWTTALLAHLVDEDGRVRGVELEPDLAQQAAADLSAIGRPWATVEAATPDVLGLPEDAPYDRILVSAAATEVPAALVEQLADDGVMVVPVGGTMTRVEKRGGEVGVSEHGAYRFVPLR
jgi:protein-L-isoaspartate(D-aspartate) O-methyltransferase